MQSSPSVVVKKSLMARTTVPGSMSENQVFSDPLLLLGPANCANFPVSFHEEALGAFVGVFGDEIRRLISELPDRILQ